MEDFKQYLNDDAEDEERAAAEQVRLGLSGLRLERKVAQVAAERKALLRRTFWSRIIGIATLVFMVGAAFLFFWNKEKPAQPPSDPQRQIEQTPPLQQPETPPQQAPDQPKKQSIAERPRTSREQAEQPLVRSVQPDLDTMTTRLIQILLRITVNNDILYREEHFDKRFGWGKIVQLLRDNKPIEAKVEIFDAYPDHPEGDWLLGIALLEEGKADEALALFEKIAKNPKHHRQKEARLAVEALQN